MGYMKIADLQACFRICYYAKHLDFCFLLFVENVFRNIFITNIFSWDHWHKICSDMDPAANYIVKCNCQTEPHI